MRIADRTTETVALGAPSERARIGFASRELQPGAEHRLIREFVHGLRLHTAEGLDVTAFEEPRLPTGFPDLVLVVWNRATARQWQDARSNLGLADLKIAHLLATCGALSEPDIVRLSGGRSVRENLGRLLAAGLAGKYRAEWRIVPLSRCFAVKEIIAFEAKVKASTKAIAQAHANAWFASRSYALFPARPKSSAILGAARSLGVGIWVHGARPVAICRALRRSQPLSYASWLFNEWVWRIARQDRDF